MGTLGWMRVPFAEDFAAERRERALRRRLQEALLHGAGTVWGLVAAAGEQQTNGHRTRVVVRAGMAVDSLGRELYVDREQYLDVDGLVSHSIWSELLPPDGPVAADIRRAYIVLRHEPCAAESLPAIAGHGHRHRPSPTDARQSLARAAAGTPPPQALARAVDTFRIELSPVVPPEARALRRERFAAFAAAERDASLADPCRELLLQEQPLTPSSRPTSVPGAASDTPPLLLATLDLGITSIGGAPMAYIVESTPVRPNPDNRVRASLPGAQIMAETLFGGALCGRSS